MDALLRSIENQKSMRAFNHAIINLRLSEDENAINYAGNFMYMGCVNERDLFKNINTREYLK